MAFALFDDCYSVDSSKRVITKKIAGSATAYGIIPIRIGNGQRGVHQFHLKLVHSSGYYCYLGIDQGRKNMNTSLYISSTNHYVLRSYAGSFYEKGISQLVLTRSVRKEMFRHSTR